MFLPLNNKFLIQIFGLLSQKKYTEAEKNVLDILSGVVENRSEKGNDNYLVFLEVLYNDFDFYYRKWLQKKGLSDGLLEDNTTHIEHDQNYFLHHCSNPGKMNDLLWELGVCLMTKKDIKNRKRIVNTIEKYRKIY